VLKYINSFYAFGGIKMFISVGQKLRGLSRVRFGFRLKGSAAWIMLILYGLFYMCWYLMLGTLWLLYGMCYLFFYLPIKGIVKLCKNNAKKKKIADAAQKYDHNYTSSI
jgi:hypothetical protein